MEKKKIMEAPNPGSKEAQEQGCICPVVDNNYGEGFAWGKGKKCFWMTDGCPLHRQKGKVRKNNSG